VKISENAKDLLYKMLEFYEDSRWDAYKIMEHPLLMKKGSDNGG